MSKPHQLRWGESSGHCRELQTPKFGENPKIGQIWGCFIAEPSEPHQHQQPLPDTTHHPEREKTEQRKPFNCNLLYYFVNVNFTKRFTINDHIGLGFFCWFFFKWNFFYHMKTAMSTVPAQGGVFIFSLSFFFLF